MLPTAVEEDARGGESDREGAALPFPLSGLVEAVELVLRRGLFFEPGAIESEVVVRGRRAERAASTSSSSTSAIASGRPGEAVGDARPGVFRVKTMAGCLTPVEYRIERDLEVANESNPEKLGKRGNENSTCTVLGRKNLRRLI